MKFLIFATLILTVSVTADEAGKEEDLRSKYQEECLTDANLTLHQYGKVFFRWEHTEEKEVHEYALCFLKKMGVFTEETGFNVERLLNEHMHPRLDKEKGREFLKTCVSNSEDMTPAKRAYLGLECLANGRFNYDAK